MKAHALISCLICALLLSSCMTLVHTQKTAPSELNFAEDTNTVLFVNYFDYTVPAYIKDKQEVTYMNGVKGFRKGLGLGFMGDPSVHFVIGDTLAKKYTVLSMQDSSFIDTIRTVCKRYNAGLLIALDSINIWMYENQVTDEENNITSEYYLYSSNYVTLYSADGQVIDRNTAEKSKFYKSRPAFFLGLLTFTPSLTKAAADAARLSEEAGKAYADRFYPSSETVDINLYNSKAFTEINKNITAGNPVLAIEPLRVLTGSPNKGLAKKAAHNLSVVYEIMEDRRTTDQINSEFKGKR